jgi:hypothetical protein
VVHRGNSGVFVEYAMCELVVGNNMDLGLISSAKIFSMFAT